MSVPEDMPVDVSFAARLNFWAATIPEQPAVTVETEQLNFAELAERGTQMGRLLLDAGVTHGDFVTIAEPNSLEFFVATVACWYIGAIPQPVSSRLPALELESIIELADPAAVIGHDVPGRASFPAGYRPDPHSSNDPLPDAISPAWKAPTSGGSTGRPKLIVSGDPSVATAAMIGSAMLFGAVTGDTMVMPGPMYHNGPFIWSMTTLLHGGHVALLRRFDAEATLAAIEHHGATAIYLVPTMMQRMWKLPDAVKEQYDLSSLRRAFHLAEPCPEWLKDEWINWIGPDVLYELYGGTEGMASTVISGTEWLEHRGSVGKPSAGLIKICDDDGNDVPAGTVGEVWMKPADPDRVTYRYIGAETDAREGWESLGDIGWMDADGYLYLADRRKDMILVGGANIYPAEVEAAINAHPAVESCAVVGLPDPERGNQIHAIIQAAAPIDTDALRSFLSERLVSYKLPRSFEFVDEALRDDAGKVRRAALTEERLSRS